jgi:hypothetical protein
VQEPVMHEQYVSRSGLADSNNPVNTRFALTHRSATGE